MFYLCYILNLYRLSNFVCRTRCWPARSYKYKYSLILIFIWPDCDYHHLRSYQLWSIYVDLNELQRIRQVRRTLKAFYFYLFYLFLFLNYLPCVFSDYFSVYHSCFFFFPGTQLSFTFNNFIFFIFCLASNLIYVYNLMNLHFFFFVAIR